MVAAGAGAAAAIVGSWLFFAVVPLLRDDWPLRYALPLLGGALVLGALAAGVLAYGQAAPATVRRAAWLLAVTTAVASLVVIAVDFAQGLENLE